MRDRLYVGVDLGTTGVKVGLFDSRGRQSAFAHETCPLLNPAPGRVELDAQNYTDLAVKAIKRVLIASGIEKAGVCGIGLSSQGQTFVMLDDGGRPLRPAMSWLDVRAEAEAIEIEAISKRPVGPIASAAKLLWLVRNEPASVTGASRFLMLPDYLIWRLTGRAVSDPHTAASSRLWDSASGSWVPELLDFCGLDEAMLPEVLVAGEPAGTLDSAVAHELGLPAGVVVAVGTNDQLAAAIGAGNVEPGLASMSLGTALAIVLTTTEADPLAPNIISSRHVSGEGLRAALAYAKTAGVVLDWFRSSFSPEASYEELIREAERVPIGSCGVGCLPHFSGTGTPDFDPSARGAFAGLSLGTTRAHMVRAVMESLAFTVRANVELLAGIRPVAGLRAVGGGSRSDAWLRMIADATGLTVERPAVIEAACLGAAALAMKACGTFSAIGEASRAVYRSGNSFRPDPSLQSAYDRAYSGHIALRRALRGIEGVQSE